MFCKNCGKEISEGTKFCPSCGASQENTVSAPATRKCKGCGEEIASDLIFCPKCGVRQNSSTDREQSIDKMVANAASVTDDVSSVISDAYSLVKFGKKVGKATVKEVTEKKAGASSRSRVVSALLGFFLGTIGVHSFYLGKTTSGIIHLLMTLAGIVLAFYGGIKYDEGLTGIGVILIVANSIWAVIEAVLLLCGAGKDGRGIPVKNWT